MRIACVSDTHLTVPELDSKSLFPRQMARLARPEAEKLYWRMRAEIILAYSTCLQWLMRQRKNDCDLVVHLGDITGGYQEQGCINPAVQVLISQVKRDLGEVSPLARFVIGDHDTGYTHRGSLPGGGINEESLDFLKATLGQLFWAEEFDGTLHLGVCSPIAQYSGSNPRIAKLRDEQAEFVGDALQRHRGEWMLYIHRPAAVRFLDKEMKDHLGRLRKMVYGHYHDPAKGRLVNAIHLLSLAGDSIVWKCLEKAVLCPSTAPLWWRGYGLLVLNENGSKNQEIVLSRPPESQDIPASSFWRCLWWMAKSRC